MSRRNSAPETSDRRLVPPAPRKPWVDAVAAGRIKRQIVDSYDDFVIRSYCKVRFLIMNLQMLEEIEQYLPRQGRVLDVGGGFGLFSLFFASCAGERSLLCFDIDRDRIKVARKSSEKLGLADRVRFVECDVLDYPFDERVDGVVVLDLLHHIPEDTVPPILKRFHDVLSHGGIAIVKDVEATPWPKVAFTWLLDKIMNPWTPVRYYRRDEMMGMLEGAGFDVKFHLIRDVLPYPHIMYVCRKVP